jgi:hypothetical protein
MLDWNLAEEYAKRFHLPDQVVIEESWQFRERVARSLEDMGHLLLAHEVLYNRHMSSDLFAHGRLSDGYDDMLIKRIAQQTEAAFQHEGQQEKRRQKRKKILEILHFWH